jgi:5-methylcytosine-specific restriction endonuclease McrA
MTKKERIAVWNKYNKHCAYCGKEIAYNEMQVDHKHPQHLAFWNQHLVMREKYHLTNDINDFENLMPSCRRCNHYKRGERLETFRKSMLTLHKRLQEIYINKVAIDYGIITMHTWDGVFYFEHDESGDGS